MYVGSSILYTTDNNANKATENILDPSGGIVGTKRFDGKYENMYFKFTYDARGSIISILDPDINRVKGYGYDDAGNTTEVGDSSFKNEVKYGGMIEDEASGLHYMNARHYNPTSGRFLTEDTYNDPLSPDLYTYAGNNPVNYVDPTGHFTEGVLLGGLLSTPVGQAILVGGLIIGIICVGTKLVCDNIEKSRWQSFSNSASVSISSSENSKSRYYPSSWMNHDSGMRDGTWMIPDKGIPFVPNQGTNGINGNYTNPSREMFINGIPLSQELSRVSEDVARIQMKAVENTPDEGGGEAGEDVFGIPSTDTPTASQLRDYAKSKGWMETKTSTGPEKWIDENGIPRITMKKGSSRTPGSENPHVEIRNKFGQRTDRLGNPVSRKSLGNHTSILWR